MNGNTEAQGVRDEMQNALIISDTFISTVILVFDVLYYVVALNISILAIMAIIKFKSACACISFMACGDWDQKHFAL